MGIENLKRWHWIAIGVVVGIVLALVNAQLAQNPQPEIRRGVTIQQFTRFAEAQLLGNAEPFIIELKIYPPVEGRNLVTGKISLAPGRRRNYEAFELVAPIPFLTPGASTAVDPDYTVREYLQAKAPHLGYRYAWWEDPQFAAGLWLAGSILVIGGVWPIVLNLLIGAGLGRARAPVEPEYDLDRFGKDEPQRWSEAQRELTEADIQRLREVEAELERNLAAGVSTNSPAEAVATLSEPSPVKTLSSDPLDAAVTTTTEEGKDYRGEYYPVAHPMHRPSQTGG